MTYKLIIDESTGCTIRCGDRYQDKLGHDEALWILARILTGSPEQGYAALKTEAEHKAQHAAWFGPASILEDWQKLIAAATPSYYTFEEDGARCIACGYFYPEYRGEPAAQCENCADGWAL